MSRRAGRFFCCHSSHWDSLLCPYLWHHTFFVPLPTTRIPARTHTLRYTPLPQLRATHTGYWDCHIATAAIPSYCPSTALVATRWFQRFAITITWFVAFTCCLFLVRGRFVAAFVSHLLCAPVAPLPGLPTTPTALLRNLSPAT